MIIEVDQYKIKKVLNNNVVQAVSGFNEVIVVGLGIGFNVKARSVIPHDKIEKIFELKQDEYYKVTQLVKDIPDDRFFKLYRAIETSASEAKLELDSHAYVTLIDHLNFAQARVKSGQMIQNLLMYDLRILYPEEFYLGQRILKRVNDIFDIELPEDEVGFLTMHIVNGVHSQIKNQSSILTDMILDCLNIIRDAYLVSLKLDDLATQRIMIHLKMLIQRVMENIQVDFDEEILHNVIVEFESAFICAQKIRNYIEKRLSTQINSQEIVYLTIHLNRLEQILL